MDPEELRARETAEGLSAPLAALWWDGWTDWRSAHEIAQTVDNAETAWVHAYLHLKEGDLPNADYWYRRAGRRRPEHSLDAEWTDIVMALS